ncbi:TetR/AcrR family transcriptional regulator [Streptomyces sp. NPDC018019]|uniref:TetR/AcrR family transcriptional regulator n=1 Tax=Streptomyces sp. NPDC018019 TaxID=3365030 RepID=UPI0037B3B77F
MEFQRARSDEQRLERRRQVLATAAAMLTEMPVAKLSLNELSRRIGLAKSNVLRYFESREAVLLELLQAEMHDWVAELEHATGGAAGTPRERGDGLAETLAASLAGRPVLCDLLAAQSAVLEHNISTEVAVRHKHAAWQNTQALIELVRRHLPELGAEGASRLAETTVLTAMAAWPCSHPSEALRAAYDSDPALAALRMDFTDLVRHTVEVTASGLLARQEPASARPAS